jgi:hypothetical protein
MTGRSLMMSFLPFWHQILDCDISEFRGYGSGSNFSTSRFRWLQFFNAFRFETREYLAIEEVPQEIISRIFL